MLTENEVHLWCAYDYTEETPEMILSVDELARAKRLLQFIDQKKFMAARALLRRVLSRYLSISPEKIQFEMTEHGKPFVRDTDIQFNLSHAGDCVLVGVTQKRSIGVDVERVREKCDYLGLAKRFFTPAEFIAIQSAQKPIDAFYRCWTRKEAFLKATGIGLSFGLSNFEVSVLENAALLSVEKSTERANAWYLESIVSRDAYFAAIAVQKPVGPILYYDVAHDFS